MLLAQCLFNIFSGVISGVLSVWFKICLSFLSVWFRVDSLGQWFIADCHLSKVLRLPRKSDARSY